MCSSDEQDQIQRSLNEAKKRQLEERYGGIFRSNSTLPPEVEADWLAHIEEFERQFEAAGQTTVRNYCGNPEFTPVARVPPAELERELNNVLEFLSMNGIEVHFGSMVSPSDAYRFITEELLDEEMDDIRIEGMTQNFIYEEFHPDERSDAGMYAEMFLRRILGHPEQCGIVQSCAMNEFLTPDGRPATAHDLHEQIDAFKQGVAAFIDYDATAISCNIAEGYATVELEVSWQGLRAGSMENFSAGGRATVRLKQSEAADWLVVQFTLPA